jgi:peptidoglycan hydrolase-like protein with peptidoglycan-binding domain
MGNTQAYSSKPQTLFLGLLRRTALSLLAMSLGYATLVHVTTANAFSQVAGSTTTTGAAATEATGASADALIRPTLKPGSRGSEVTELQATLKLLGYYGGTVDGVYGQTTVSAVSQFQQAAGLNADGITGPATWNRLFPATGDLSTLPTAGATPTTPVANNTGAPSTGSGSASFPVPGGVSPTLPSSQPSSQPIANPRPAVKPTPAKVSPTPAKPAAEIRPTTVNTPTTASVSLPILKQGMKGSAVLTLQERLRSIGVFKGASDGVFGAETLTAVKAAQRRFKLEPDGVVGGATWSALLR